jgi:alanyl-tRNA synthetase
MKSNEIRRLFLDFFRQKGHEVLPSSSLIPAEDQTLLFTNAGMVQFKSVFLGEEKRPYNRAVTSQKCLRAGGKHNDLENVGRTARHHTFFEMLGNFSFGDYFKKEATQWALEFLTESVRLPKDELLITIYEKDDEAADIWENEAGVSSERIFRLGEKDNFWQMGETGPCGPCSEILIDQGKEIGCGRPQCRVGCDCDRFLEIWNLVFMQYNKDSAGRLSPLPKPSIDTGMGIERLAAVLQGKKNNFDSDLFIPVIREIENVSGKKYGAGAQTDVSLRVIADHIRAIAFVLSDGLIPSNEGRGYVLRRIIRRAARHGFILGIEEPFLYKIIGSVYDTMSEPYPELLENTGRTEKILRFEEERFAHTLSSGMVILDRLMKESRSSGIDTIPGAELFRLYDTYGFPLDLARDIAEDNELNIDEQGFSREMELQRTRARASWTGSEEDVPGVYREIIRQLGSTEFSGYETLQEECTVRALIRDGVLVEEVEEGEDVEIILDRSPFYGEAGGQVGDSGIIKGEGFKAEVLDTKKYSDIIIHNSAIKKGTLKAGTKAVTSVDGPRRKSIMRNHTATHLLHSALRAVLGDHIKQSGSLVAPERLRFDFTHFYKVEKKELGEIEELVNEKIIENMPVTVNVMNLDDAIVKGVVALFGEKYGEQVRVVRAGDFTAELCGGTHTHYTGDIGPFKVISEGSVAAGIRRIEALTGLPALEFIRNEENELRKVAEVLKVDEFRVYEKLEKLLAELKSKERELGDVKDRKAFEDIKDIIGKAVAVDNFKVLACRIDGYDMKTLRNLADAIRDKLGSGVIVLGSSSNGQGYYVAAVTKDLTKRLNAGEILRAVTGGKGGGRADMAQGGSKDVNGIDKAINSVVDIVEKQAKNLN